ncbi:MAG TPA: carbamoyltransferase HypF, partial [Allocoleopsis sp.]
EKYPPTSPSLRLRSGNGEGDKFFTRQSFISPLPLGEGLGVRAVIQNNIAENIAPNNPYLAVMLPSNPLHIILMKELNFPIVATSGNISDEPICIDENEALLRLQNIADLFLIHNRPIVRPIDDSIVRIIQDQEMILRRARGYAPLPIPLTPFMKGGQKENVIKHKILAVGGHLKNTIAIAHSNQVFISQHIGDLSTKLARESFENIIASFEQLYQFKPEAIACDLHPDYSSSQYAQNYSIPIIKVQHHYAHILSCMAENDLLDKCPLLGIAWDGTGYGLDGTIWGGEFLQINPSNFDRIAHFKPFKLPGGDNAIKSPKRIAIALLYEIFGNDVFEMHHLAPIQSCTPQELSILKTMLQKNINTVITTSVGRLFDAISSILNISHTTNYEGQAAIKLEFALEKEISAYYPYEIVNNVIDWTKIIKEILTDVKLGLSLGYISTKFHNTLCEIILSIARQTGHKRVIISGGCFQNKYLLETTIKKLIDAKFSPHWSQKIPPNDGGIALGQIIAAERSFCDVCL